jgi:hypothetical protein
MESLLKGPATLLTQHGKRKAERHGNRSSAKAAQGHGNAALP